MAGLVKVGVPVNFMDKPGTVTADAAARASHRAPCRRAAAALSARMAKRTHHYPVTLRWTGNRGSGTASYTGYDRSFSLDAPVKPTIAGSSDPAFRGDSEPLESG